MSPEKGMQAAGTAIQSIGAISSGYSQAKQLRAEQKVDYANADNANLTASMNADQVARQGRQQIGEQAASTAQAGIGFSGSAGDLLKQSETNLDLDILNTIYGGQVKAAGYRTQGNAAGKRAQGAITSGYIGAASSLLKGASGYGRSAKPMGAVGGYGSIGNYSGSYTGQIPAGSI